MQTYSAESIPSQWPALLDRVIHGEEIMITEQEKPIARLIPAHQETYLDRIRALRGTLRGINTDVENEDDPA
ncbi:MAG TPA: type II toxin-antitoxin system prevent-host-death family antitoxin [Candidatus Kapabacteria bacterium]|jgi:antitoxin (DNA-binding transcriptional repressor) of toxin-antitoxin stability system